MNTDNKKPVQNEEQKVSEKNSKNNEGRTKIYISNAERQKAYRDRINQSVRRKLHRAQYNWNYNHHAVQLDVFEERPEKMYFLLTIGEEYLIACRFHDSKQKFKQGKIEYRKFPKDEAINTFNKLKMRDGSSVYWENVDDKKSQARNFLAKYDSGKDFFYHYPLYEMPFMFALAEEKDVSLDLSKIPARRYIVRLLSGLTFPQEEKAQKAFVKEMFIKIAEDVNDEGFVARGTYHFKANIIIEMLTTLSLFSDVYPPIARSMEHFRKTKEEVAKKYEYNPIKNLTGTIIDAEHYKYFQYDHLNKILDLAYDASPSFFNFCILGLSTGLRLTELEKLIDGKFRYVTEGAFLNYKGGELVTKTAGKVELSLMVNPELSIVSRLILFYDNILNIEDFFDLKKDKIRLLHPEMKDYVARCFRTTCATMLAYCDKLNGRGRASLRDAQNRLGHSTMNMVIRIYAKRIPSTGSPLRYYNFSGVIKIDGHDITQHSNLWDSWLLQKYVEKTVLNLSHSQNADTELRKFKMLCLSEAKKFDEAVGANVEGIPDASF